METDEIEKRARAETNWTPRKDSQTTSPSNWKQCHIGTSCISKGTKHDYEAH